MPELKIRLKNFRAVFRLCRAGLHLLWAVVTVACAFPFLPIQLQRALRVRWSRQLLEVLGIQLRISGIPSAGGLLVSNHISWLDIYAINASVPSNFVSKDEVRAWPLVGWLSAQTETVFLERGSRNAAMRAKMTLVDELRKRSCIAVFPEGTTSKGDTVLPFHSALFQSAIDAGIHVKPVTMRYTDRDEMPSAAPAYVGETTLWQCLLAIVSADRLTAHVDFLPAFDPAGINRRQLAEQTHRLVAKHLARQVTAVQVDDTRSDGEFLSCAGALQE